jgi:hypothetical protein
MTKPVKTFHVAAQSVDDGFCPDIRIDVFPFAHRFMWTAVDADEDGANFSVRSQVTLATVDAASDHATRSIASLFA